MNIKEGDVSAVVLVVLAFIALIFVVSYIESQEEADRCAWKVERSEVEDKTALLKACLKWMPKGEQS